MKQILFFLLISSSSFGQLPTSEIGATKIPIDSKVLGYEYEIWVNLPNEYDSTKSYPVLYVLDAEWRFDITRALVRELAVNDKCPQHIVVGIPQIDWQHRFKNLTFTDSPYNQENEIDSTNFWNDDITSGGSDFVEFLEKEVAAYVNDTYNTNGFDVLMGHSLGAYFSTYAMVTSTMFNAYQIYDPSTWYNGGETIDKLKSDLAKDTKTSVFIAQAQGGQPRDAFHIRIVDTLDALLNTYPGIRSEYVFYEDEFHNTMYMYAVQEGMEFLYEGFDFGFIAPDDEVTVADYENHFKRFSEKVNFTFHPKSDGFRWVGYANFSQGKWNEALLAYEKMGAGFENDTFYLNEAGTCYEELGKYPQAIEIYNQILVLDPNNEEIKEKLQSLKNKKGR